MTTEALTYPFDREGPLDMPPEFAWLRDNAPVTPVTLPGGDTAWLVTRYEDCRRVLSDWRFSRDLSRPGTARVNPAIGFGNYGNPFADPPEHTRWRSQVAKAFTARQIEAMRPRITAVVEDLVGEMAGQGPPAELMQALAYPLPITMMCQMLGIPFEDSGRFRGWVDVVLASDRSGPERDAAGLSLVEYSRQITAAKREHPEDDLLSGLAAPSDKAGRLNDDEIFITIMTLLVAGYKTSAAHLARGLLTLFRHPDQYQALRADPSLADTAADELLRHSAPGAGLGLSRYATADVEVGGVVIPKGATVLVARNSANRDDAHFPDGDRLDITRSTAHQHLTFGAGPAFCFGAPLARMELQTAFRVLLSSFPALSLAIPESEIRWRLDSAAQLPFTLPVTW